MVKALAHEAIYDVVAGLLAPLPRGRLLDVPAGEGALASRLVGLGFDVRCCDLYPEMFRLPDVEIKRGDLTSTLPYDDGSFDYVVCVEGLEHIENPHQAAREFGRLLRPGGRLITSVPNILNIEERLKWLLYGYTSHFKPLSREHLAKMSEEFGGREEVALHINPIAYPELRYVLEKNGFELLGLHRDRPKKNSWAYFPFVALIRVLNRCQPARRRSERWAAELQSDEVLLGGNTLVVEAVKS
ncbi:MAG TPA: class I SAM-dependent methyltransferase [Rubricoccaceae bacterium]|nr:class I SAM-dependent methyltransferase [Rubricoccaceae bacterium]